MTSMLTRGRSTNWACLALCGRPFLFCQYLCSGASRSHATCNSCVAKQQAGYNISKLLSKVNQDVFLNLIVKLLFLPLLIILCFPWLLFCFVCTRYLFVLFTFSLLLYVFYIYLFRLIWYFTNAHYYYYSENIFLIDRKEILTKPCTMRWSTILLTLSDSSLRMESVSRITWR